MAQGTALVDFGAFPGGSDTSLFVAAPTIGAGSLVEAWIFPATTADHSADEHLTETIKVMAGNVQAGVGFTIYMSNTNTLAEPVQQQNQGRAAAATGQAFGAGQQDRCGAANTQGGMGTRIYGQWSVGWVFN